MGSTTPARFWSSHCTFAEHSWHHIQEEPSLWELHILNYLLNATIIYSLFFLFLLVRPRRTKSLRAPHFKLSAKCYNHLQLLLSSSHFFMNSFLLIPFNCFHLPSPMQIINCSYYKVTVLLNTKICLTVVFPGVDARLRCRAWRAQPQYVRGTSAGHGPAGAVVTGGFTSVCSLVCRFGGHWMTHRVV
jgi:hypothetical protein